MIFLTDRENELLGLEIESHKEAIDEKKFIDYISLGASIEDIEVTFNLTRQQIESYCERTFHTDFLELSRKLTHAFIIEANYQLLRSARSGNALATKTLSNSFGQSMDKYDAEMLKLKQTEIAKQSKAQQETVSLITAFITNVQNEVQISEKQKELIVDDE